MTMFVCLYFATIDS